MCNGAGNQSISQWFNKSRFTEAPLQEALAAGHPEFGNPGRNILYGPGINTWDFDIYRDFPLTERLGLQVRGEFFNLFNHPDFDAPDATINSPLFGQITGAGSPREVQLAYF